MSNNWAEDLAKAGYLAERKSVGGTHVSIKVTSLGLVVEVTKYEYCQRHVLSWESLTYCRINIYNLIELKINDSLSLIDKELKDKYYKEPASSTFKPISERNWTND